MKEQSLSMKKNHNSTPVSSVCIVAAIMLLFYGVRFTQAKDFNTPPPNAPYQQPAFEGQTRAPIIEENVQLDVQIVADGLVYPWGMDQLPDGNWLVTERPGRMRLISANGRYLTRLPACPGLMLKVRAGYSMLWSVMILHKRARSGGAMPNLMAKDATRLRWQQVSCPKTAASSQMFV